jgi:hypothetical protein
VRLNLSGQKPPRVWLEVLTRCFDPSGPPRMSTFRFEANEQIFIKRSAGVHVIRVPSRGARVHLHAWSRELDLDTR